MRKTLLLITILFICATSFADDQLRVISIDGISAFPIEKCHRIHYNAQSDRIEIQLADTIFSCRANESTLLDFQDKYYTAINPDSVPYNQIWYRTLGDQLHHFDCIDLYGVQPFDCTIMSHTYENGLGVIVCDDTIRVINDHAFGNGANITEIYLPDNIQYLATGALHTSMLKTLRIPKDLKIVDSYALNNPTLVSFSGHHVSADGKCVIIDSVLYAFAPKNVKKYVTPEGVHTISWYAFALCEDLESIHISEGVKYIYGDAFYNSNLKEVYLPNTLENLNEYAFHTCYNLENVSGNTKFRTADGKCITYIQNNPSIPIEQHGTWLMLFIGNNLEQYTIPEGIVGIENYAFTNKKNLKSVTLPTTLVNVGAYAFYQCDNLEAIYGLHTSEDNRAIVFGDYFRYLAARKDLPSNYVIPDDVTSIGYSAFANCESLTSITMSDKVTAIEGYAFESCPNLKTITLSAGLIDISGDNAFIHSYNLESIYMRAPIPPKYSDEQMSDFPNLSIYVPQESIELYKKSPDWELWRDYFKPYDYGDLSEFKYYISTDYSQNMLVDTLQLATIGNGIDIVLMGDAYSDRQIADSTYHKDVKYLYDNLFTEEPYKSYKEMFNVYIVNVVSSTEGYEYRTTALGGFFGDGTYVGGNDGAVIEYASQAVPYEKLDNAIVIVAMNSDRYAGTCYMYYPAYNNNNFGTGLSISYFPKGCDEEIFAQLLHHEALGHGFAKLADEYAYEANGNVPESTAALHQEQQTNWGWWKNIDFTNDSAEIRWSRLLLDERYQYDGLGAFEGGLTYWTGVWRPTENSIMRYNTGGFNAPSREAIYYRIHKLAYGDEWEFDYEKFVEWDAKNRQTQSDALRMPTRKETQNFVPLHPPVIKQMTWREALDRKQTPQKNLIKAKEGLPVYDKSINHLQNTNKYVVTTDSYDEL